MLRIFQRWVVKAINSFMSWVGGKKALRDEILARFPLEYKRYIEVFGGAGWVLFHKPPGNDFEVFNDFNGNLVNLYRCVREQPDIIVEALHANVLYPMQRLDRHLIGKVAVAHNGLGCS